MTVHPELEDANRAADENTFERRLYISRTTAIRDIENEK